jgi:hypothetical protein
MRRTLSSAQTFVMKFISPAACLGGSAAGYMLMFTSGKFPGLAAIPLAAEMKWLFLGATVLGGILVYWFCMRLKRVALDDRWLYISNYLREIRVPLENVAGVSENRWLNTHPITVAFRQDTDFGSQIIFMPKARWLTYLSAHPVVEELEAAVRQVRGLPPEQPAA